VTDWPIVQCAVAYTVNNGSAANAKVVLSHVAPIPHVAEAAARALNGQAVTQTTATAAGRAATEGAKPLARNAYKVKLVEVAVKRAAMMAAGLQRYWEV
jgi:xanthine dehydrogenase YagS FAD-binding subunit